MKAMSDNYCVACGARIPDGRHICPKCERQSRKTAHTNGDFVRLMSDEQLAKILQCPTEGGWQAVTEQCMAFCFDCEKCRLEWLKAERRTEK